MAKTNVTWTQKVLAKFNLSEEGKVGLFGDTLVKEWKKAIRDANREIKSREIEFKDAQEDYLEKLEDLKEAYKNTFLEVDMDEISTSTARKEYTREFTEKLLHAYNRVKGLEAMVAVNKMYHEAEIEAIKEKIALTEEFIAAIEGKEEKE